MDDFFIKSVRTTRFAYFHIFFKSVYFRNKKDRFTYYEKKNTKTKLFLLRIIKKEVK